MTTSKSHKVLHTFCWVLLGVTAILVAVSLFSWLFSKGDLLFYMSAYDGGEKLCSSGLWYQTSPYLDQCLDRIGPLIGVNSEIFLTAFIFAAVQIAMVIIAILAIVRLIRKKQKNLSRYLKIFFASAIILALATAFLGPPSMQVSDNMCKLQTAAEPYLADGWCSGGWYGVDFTEYVDSFVMLGLPLYLLALIYLSVKDVKSSRDFSNESRRNSSGK
jgi:uncharacterized membrane protein